MVIGQDMSDIRRMSIDKDLLRETMSNNHAMALTQDIFDYLEDKFLIRRETIGGRIHYEVSHDVLLAPLLKSRSETRQKAAEIEARAEQRAQQAAAEQRAADAEAMAAQERLARIEADRRRKRARMLAFGAIFGLILASVFGVLAFRARDKAKTLQATAEKNEQDAKEQQRKAEAALKLVIAIKKEKINNQINLDKAAQFYLSESKKRNLLHEIDSLERIKAPLSEILLILEEKR
jgi:predicted nucleic acid-binding Zn ribbon protein